MARPSTRNGNIKAYLVDNAVKAAGKVQKAPAINAAPPPVPVPSMPSLTFAASLLKAGKITQQDHDTLASLITADVTDVSDVVNSNLRVRSTTGFATIGSTICAREVDAIVAVFDTAELLEAILVPVLAADLILNVPLVCKGFHQAIEASTVLKRQTYRLPQASPPKPLECFPVKIRGFELLVREDFNDVTELRVRPKNVEEHVWDDSKFRVYQVGLPMFKTGLYFDQELFEDEKVCGPDSQPEEQWLRNPTGITFGDVLDIVKEYRGCGIEYTFFMDTGLSGKCESERAFEKWVAPRLKWWV